MIQGLKIFSMVSPSLNQLKFSVWNLIFMVFTWAPVADGQDLKPVIYFDGIYKGAFAGKSETSCPQLSKQNTSEELEDYYFEALCESFGKQDFGAMFQKINESLVTNDLVTFDAISKLKPKQEGTDKLDFCKLNISFITLDKIFLFVDKLDDESVDTGSFKFYTFFTFYVFRGQDRKMVYSRQFSLSLGPFNVDKSSDPKDLFLETLSNSKNSLTDAIVPGMIEQAVDVKRIESIYGNELLMAEENFTVINSKVIPKIKKKYSGLIADYTQFEQFASYFANAHFANELALVPSINKVAVKGEMVEFSHHLKENIIRGINNARAVYSADGEQGKVFTGNPCGDDFFVGGKVFPDPKNKINVYIQPGVKRIKVGDNHSGSVYFTTLYINIRPIEHDPDLVAKLKKAEKPNLTYKSRHEDNTPSKAKKSDIYHYLALINAYVDSKVTIFEHYKNIKEIEELFEWL
jgi:hypothetical protein